MIKCNGYVLAITSPTERKCVLKASDEAAKGTTGVSAEILM